MKRIFMVILLVGLGIFLVSGNIYGQKEGTYVPGEIIVKLRDGKSLEDIQMLNALYRVQSRDIFADLPTPEKKIEELRKRYEDLIERSKDYSHKASGELERIREEIDKYERLIEHREERRRRAPSDIVPIKLENYFHLKTDNPDVNINRMIIEYESDPAVEFAQPNNIYTLQSTPNDEYFYRQWHLEKIYAPEAWDFTKEDGVIIAILDSGIDYNHQDLASNIIAYGSVIDSSDGMDFDGHGTKCAGVAAAITNNIEGVAGVAGNSKLLGIKVLYNGNYITDTSVALGVAVAKSCGADVINMSIGYPAGQFRDYAFMEMTTKSAFNEGCILVAAAGSYGQNLTYIPALFPHVVAVAATNEDDTKYSLSNYDYCVNISAPGEGLYTTTIEGTYDYLNNTSAACPVVSGVMALAVSHYKDSGLTNRDIIDRVLYSADDIYDVNPEYVGQLGTGRVNAYRALCSGGSGPDILRFSIRDVKIEEIEGNGNSIPEAYEKVNIVITIENLMHERYPVPKLTAIARPISSERIFFVDNEAELDLSRDGKGDNANDPFVFRLGDIDSDTRVAFFADIFVNEMYLTRLCFKISLGIGKIPTYDPDSMLYPDSIDISDNKIIWSEKTTVGDLIYCYDMEGESIIPLFLHKNVCPPKISEDKIVFVDESKDGTNLSTFLSMDFNSPIKISTAEGIFPDISGDLVVWSGKRDRRYQYIEYCRYGEDGVEESDRIIDDIDVFGRIQPAVSGNKIVWIEYSNGLDKICLYDFTTDQTEQIIGDSHYKSTLDISGDIIVWEEHVPDSQGNYKFVAYAYNISTGEKIQIMDDENRGTLSIDGSKIVWADSRNGNSDVYLYDLSTGRERQITRDPSPQFNPVISGNNIIWVDKRNGKDEIFRAVAVSDYTPPTRPRVRDEEFTNSTDTLRAWWTESYDPESGVVEYQYKIVKSIKKTIIVREYTTVGLEREVEAAGLELAHGMKYCFRVRARNGAGLYSNSSYSKGVTIDTVAPSIVNLTNSSQDGEKVILFRAEVADDLSGVDYVFLKVKENGKWRSYRMRYNRQSRVYERRIIPKIDSGRIMYMIKAYDKAGNETITGVFYIGEAGVNYTIPFGEILNDINTDNFVIMELDADEEDILDNIANVGNISIGDDLFDFSGLKHNIFNNQGFGDSTDMHNTDFYNNSAFLGRRSEDIYINPADLPDREEHEEIEYIYPDRIEGISDVYKRDYIDQAERDDSHDYRGIMYDREIDDIRGIYVFKIAVSDSIDNFRKPYFSGRPDEDTSFYRQFENIPRDIQYIINDYSQEKDRLDVPGHIGDRSMSDDVDTGAKINYMPL